MLSTDIGIDLGTASILVYIKGKGVVLKEPSVVAFDRDTNKIKAIGEEARLMLGRTPGNIVAVRPLRQGVISDYTVTEKMLKYFIQKAIGKRMLKKPRISVCVPSGVTEVEKKAVEDATLQAGAREVAIIEEPIAAAIGAGIDVTKSRGVMMVNIGAETTEISVLSLGGIVISKSIKIGGNKLDDCIINNVRKVYNLVIGSKTAEGLKKELGSAVKVDETFAPGFGRNVLSGLPVSVEISSDVIYNAIVDALHSIMDAIKVILERTPPELAADIIKDGVYVSGGTSQINNLEKFIKQETNLNVNIVDQPSESVVRGLIGVVTNPQFAKIAYTPQDRNYD